MGRLLREIFARGKRTVLTALLTAGLFFMETGTTKGAQDAPEPGELYAKSAVLLDAGSGRVLYSKNGDEALPMASTTKIMTCILALELAEPDTVCTASANAAAQPKVHLGVRSGEEYRMEDLLYALMLESDNDAAVCIAETVGGSVEGFAAIMNEKAAALGCTSTHFVTPNGLDGEDAGGVHSTTAAELARIMQYCVMESAKCREFRTITGTASYSFTDASGARSFSCQNHNTFLQLMDGAFSGKTGFTGNAGYCYVGALEKDGRTLIVALLACGWPNNRGYKWKDTRKLLEYGLDGFSFAAVGDIPLEEEQIPVENGQTPSVAVKADQEAKKLLIPVGETIRRDVEIRERLDAPVGEGETVGSIKYWMGNELLAQYEVYTAGNVEKIDYRWCLSFVLQKYIFSFC